MAPFEPLRTSSFRNLLKKTLFLVSFATAKRVSELQALSHKLTRQGDDVVVSYLPEFVAKTETILNPLPREFRIRSLPAVVGHDDERLLCPVRALFTLKEECATFFLGLGICSSLLLIGLSPCQGMPYPFS